MKKLMTMLAAVALAFGVQADGTWWEGTSFETLSADTDLDLTSGEGLMWATNGVPKEMKVVDITGTDLTSIARAKHYQDITITRALSVKTNFGEPVFRTNTTEKTMGTLYVDTLVKPTIAEDDSSFTNEAKIAIWFKEVCDANDNPIATNLMIRAGYIKADGTCVATNYNCGAVSGADEWQRFTIKSFEDITTGAGYPGFVVFRNGLAVQCASDKGDSNAAALQNLATQPGLYHKYDELFPSADKTSTTISKIGFDGTGIVDDLLFTDEEEEYAAPFKTFNLAWDANVTGFTYAIDSDDPVAVTGLAGAGSRVLEVAKSTTSVIISNVTFVADYVFNTVTTSGAGIAVNTEDEYVELSVTKGSVTAASTATITSKYDAPNVYVTIGGVTKHYIDLAAAFSAVNAATGDVTMQMAANGLSFGSTTGITLGGENLTSLTIDLNGTTNTFSGSGYAIATSVPLTITDTSALTNGAIIANYIVDAATNLTINAGIFEGAINITAGTPSITGGEFTGTITSTVGGFITGGTFSEDYMLAGYIANGYATTPTETIPVMYVVGLGNYEIVYIDSLTGDEIENTPTEYQFGDTITPATPAAPAGYAFAGWAWYDEDGEPITYVAGETFGNLELWANWSANTYTVTVGAPGDHASVVITTNSVEAGTAAGDYVVNYGDAVVVTYTPAQGYQFTVDGNTSTNIASIVENVTIASPTVELQSFTVTVGAPGDHATVAVTTNSVEAGTAGGAYAVNYGDSIAVTYTAASGYQLTTDTSTNIASVVANVTIASPTVEAAGPAPIDPSNPQPVDVEANSEEAAIEAVELATPSAAGSEAEDVAAYKSLFDITATEKSAGVYTVEVTGIKEETKEAVSTTAVDVLNGTDTGVTIPAGLYYRITRYTAIGTPVDEVPASGQSTKANSKISVSKPGDTQGFIKIEMSTNSFNN